jgi:hypothetical protein
MLSTRVRRNLRGTRLAFPFKCGSVVVRYIRQSLPPKMLSVESLGGQCKTGHAGSLQNRPCEKARDVVLFIPLSPDQASLFWFSNSSAHI